jgi:hypothetical protein
MSEQEKTNENKSQTPEESELKLKYEEELLKLQSDKNSSTFEQEKEKLDTWYETELTKLRVFEEFKSTETEIKPHVTSEQEEKVLDVMDSFLSDDESKEGELLHIETKEEKEVIHQLATSDFL